MRDHYLIVYHHLPNYRYSVFNALEETPGLEVEFAAGSASKDGSIPVIPGDSLKVFHQLKNSWFGSFLWQHGLLRLLLSRKWDAVIFLGDYGHLSSWVGAALLRLRRTPVAFWTIGWHRPETGLRKWYRLAFYRLADRLLLYGNVGRELGISHGYPDSRMGVIYNSSGMPADTATTVGTQRPPTNPCMVGTVIRLNESKRLDLLVTAVASLRKQGRNVVLEILGEGPERDRLIRLADYLGVPLSLPGAAYDEDTLRSFYSRCAVAVIPSAAGLSVTQSLRYGRPVVTHDDPHSQMPEFEAVREGETGSLYAKDDVDSLVEAIARWLDRQQTDWQLVEQACHEEIRRRWTGGAQASAVLREVAQIRRGSEGDSSTQARTE